MPKFLGLIVNCHRCKHGFQATADESRSETTGDQVTSDGPEGDSSIRSLMNSVADRIDSGFSKLHADSQHLKTLLESLRTELNAALKESLSYRDASEDLKARLETADSTSLALTLENQGLRFERADEQARFARLRHELEEEKRKAMNEIARLSATIEAMNRARLVDADSAQARSDAKIKAAEEAWESQLKSVAEELRSLRHEAEIDRLQYEHTRTQLETDLARAERERLRLEGEVNTLKSKIAHEESLLGTARDDHNKLAESHARLEEEHDSLGQQYAELVRNHRAELQQLRDDSERASATLDEVRLSTTLTEDKLREALDNLAREQAARESERATWARDLDNQRQSLAELQEQLRQSRLTSETNEPQPGSTETRRSMLETELAAKSAEVTRLKAAVAEAQRFKNQMDAFLSGLGIRLPY